MAQQGGGQQQQGQGDSNDMLWAAVFFAFFIFVLWLGKDTWLPYLFKLKYYELGFISKFRSVDSKLLEEVYLASYYPDRIDSDKFFYYLLAKVGGYYATPIAILLFIFAIAIYIKNPGTKFNKTFNMANFRKYQQGNFPQIIPPSKSDLINTDIEQGPWASSFTPLNFAKRYKLLDIIENKDYNPILGELAKVAKLKEDKARKVLSAQLGQLWEGPERLPMHTKALFAVFSAIANQDRESGFKLLKQFNESILYSNKPNFNGVNEVIKKYKDTKLIKKVEARHAYVMTVMAAILELARSDGVLATADFIWLKIIDRKLWYMLNNVGRRAAFPEVAGAIAHWRIESRMQRRLITPMVEEAVKALRLGLNEVIYPQDD